MPKRVPLQTIVVHREGKRVVPALGEAFDFTAEEVEDINRVNPDAFRKVIIEDKALESEFKADEKDAEKKAAAEAKALEDAAKKPNSATKAAAGKTSAGDL
jgi:hypothetical protein